MVDIEENVEILVGAFITIGIIITVSYVALKKTGITTAVSLTPEQIQNSYPTLSMDVIMQGITHASAGWWLICAILGIVGVVALFLILREQFY